MLQPNGARTLRTEDRLFLPVLGFWIRPQHGPKVIVLHALLVCHHKVPPSLLPFLALHLVLVNGLFRVEFREVFLEVFEDLVIHLRKP